MYSEEMVTICKTDDGKYIVSVKVKRKKDKKSKDEIMVHGSDMKTFIADDEKDVSEALVKLLPKLKKGEIEADEFAAAFGGGTEEEEE